VKVSVVVPVYDPGEHIDHCIASLLDQSLPATEYEAIFVDDGSTDGTGERLDRLAAEHENVRVVHIENSGWPGRPRNVGLDAARGDFVYFVDNDDWIEREALERLHARAVRNGADVVIGRVVGHRRGFSRDLFRRNVDRARLGRDPILSLLTPHKLFRREFLDREGIRYPEGKRRLEDHPFVLRAYLRAGVISILADYPCYHWMGHPERASASAQRIEPGYWDNLAEVLDIVEENVEPGPERDRLLSHWYRSKLLTRLGGKRLLAYDEDLRAELFADMRALATARFGPAVFGHLGSALRIRARLLEAGRLDGLLALAEAESGLKADVRVTAMRWQGARLRLELAGRLADADGAPFAVRREGGRLRRVLPRDLPGAELVTPEDRDVEDELGQTFLRAWARRRETLEELMLRLRRDVVLHEEDGLVVAEVRARCVLDTERAMAGAPARDGVWDLHAEVAGCGLSAAARLAADARALPPPDPGTARAAIPFLSGKVSVDLGGAAQPPSGAGDWLLEAPLPEVEGVDPLWLRRLKRRVAGVAPLRAAWRALRSLRARLPGR
jgi:glycosyltransferase involved in cell wall biosynthesis